MFPKCLGYLSGALRVSTNLCSEATGPRTHVLGVIRAFEFLNWVVKPFIVGDRLPKSWSAKGSEQVLAKSTFHRLMADLVRISLGIINSYRARRELGNVDWVYERFAVLQALGSSFKRKGIPWILETQGPFYFEANKDRKSIFLTSIALFIEKWAYKNCDVLVCVTEKLKEILIREFRLDPKKIIVIPNGVDTDFFDPKKYSAKKYPQKKLIIGFVGQLIAWHGLDLLIETIYDLKKEGIELGLIIIGDGIMREEWELLTRKLNLDSNIRFLGHISYEQIPKYIAGFDLGYCGLVPAQYGTMYGSPLKLYEYMAMEKAVIASAYEDANKTIVHGETGYLYPPKDNNSLKKVLHQAYNERNQLEEMGKKAREEIVLNHSWTSRVRTIIKEVERIVGNVSER